MDRMTSDRPPLSWPTLLFIAGTTAAAAAWPLYAWVYGVTLGQVVLAVGYFVACGMSITVGYHRLIAHRAYQCQPWLKAVFLIVGSAAWQGSALEWASDHVRHHSYTDTHRDPYNIRQGIWHAHVGWLLRKQKSASAPAYLADDWMIRLQDRCYVPLALTTCFVVPYLVAGAGGLLLAGVVRLVANHHVTWLVNSWAHVGDRRPFDPKVSASDNWLLAFLTFGEGWHNYHHAFPTDYRNGVSPFAFDPSKWVIWTLSLAGITYDLRRIGATHQWKRRVRAAIEHAEHDGRARIVQTRAALEKQVEHSRARLAKVLAKAGESCDLAAHASLEELRERVVEGLRDAREAVNAASRRRADRIRELVESLTVYQMLLEQLAQHEARLSLA